MLSVIACYRPFPSLLTWLRSSMKVESPTDTVSLLWMRVKMASTSPILAFSAGTKLPMWARNTIKPFWGETRGEKGVSVEKERWQEQNGKSRKARAERQEQKGKSMVYGGDNISGVRSRKRIGQCWEDKMQIRVTKEFNYFDYQDEPNFIDVLITYGTSHCTKIWSTPKELINTQRIDQHPKNWSTPIGVITWAILGVLFCVYSNLLEVNALPTGIGSSEYLHATVFGTEAAVIGHKRTHTEFLKEVPEAIGASGGRGGGGGGGLNLNEGGGLERTIMLVSIHHWVLQWVLLLSVHLQLFTVHTHICINAHTCSNMVVYLSISSDLPPLTKMMLSFTNSGLTSECSLANCARDSKLQQQMGEPG